MVLAYENWAKIYILNKFLFECNCFTVYYFLLYSKGDKLHVYIYSLFFGFLSFLDFSLFFLFRSPQSTEQSSLRFTVDSH